MGGVGSGRVPGAICRAAWGPSPAVFLASSSFLLWLLQFCRSREVPADFCLGLRGQRGLPPSQSCPGGSRGRECGPTAWLRDFCCAA